MASTSVKRSSTTAASSKQITPPIEGMDEDTIVVVIPEGADIDEHEHEREPLPTPSESATDTSSRSSGTPPIKSPAKTRSRRVSGTRKTATAGVASQPSAKPSSGNSDKLRNISGETIVVDPSLSQTSLVKGGIEKLDLEWNIGSSFDKENESIQADEIQNTDTRDGIILNSEEKDLTSLKRRESRRVKIEEKNEKWEKRKKVAEESATRRSSRASLLVSKATEVVSNIASSVLGKRSRSKDEVTGATFSQKDGIESQPTSKKAKSTTSGQIVEKQDDGVSLAVTNRALKTRAPRDKKWLISGLYAGQSRSFDPTKSESRNKRKSNGGPEPSSTPAVENSFLPLPMFAGSRLLETGRDFRLPFDIFSPLPPGQPKPDEWRKVNKNVFVGDAAAEWRTNKFSEQSTCLCTPEGGCDSDCMNRFMYYECDERNCNLTEEQCGNRAFEGLRKRVKAGGQYNVGVEVLRTADRGYGVRACRTFDPNQIIVEYTGEIINQEECESRMHGLYKDNECYYLMAFDQNMIIDATRGSIARFVNHSCDPNCRMEKWTVGGKPRMALFAGTRGIMTGEELTYDYNFDPYSQKNVQICRCGADNCRGFLGPKPKELPKKEKESALAGAKRKLAEVLEEGKEMVTGNKKRKTEEKKRLPKGWVYLEPEVIPKPLKKRKNNNDAKTVDDVDGSVVRRPSKLARKVSTAKSKSKAKLIPKAGGKFKKTAAGLGRKSVKTKSKSNLKTKVNTAARQRKRVVSANSTASGTVLLSEKEEEVQECAENEVFEETAQGAEDDSRPTSKSSYASAASTSSAAVAALRAKAESIKGKVSRSLKGR